LLASPDEGLRAAKDPAAKGRKASRSKGEGIVAFWPIHAPLPVQARAA
jgi:hypothetical protein